MKLGQTCRALGRRLRRRVWDACRGTRGLTAAAIDRRDVSPWAQAFEPLEQRTLLTAEIAITPQNPNPPLGGQLAADVWAVDLPPGFTGLEFFSLTLQYGGTGDPPDNLNFFFNNDILDTGTIFDASLAGDQTVSATFNTNKTTFPLLLGSIVGNLPAGAQQGESFTATPNLLSSTFLEGPTPGTPIPFDVATAATFIYGGFTGDNTVCTQDGTHLDCMGTPNDDTIEIFTSGNDIILDGLNGDTINGNATALFSNVQTIEYHGLAGNDQLIVNDLTGTGVTGIHYDGGDGDDEFDASAQANTAVMNTVGGGAGNDIIRGGNGPDLLKGGADNDMIFGGPGNNVLKGGGGIDELFGGDDRDLIVGGSTDAEADKAQSDLIFNEWKNAINFDAAIAAVTPLFTITNQDNNENTLRGGAGRDFLLGDVGDDVLRGEGDGDLLDAGGGNDILLGGSDADRLLGGDNRDVLIGGSDSDELEGGGEDDIIIGGNTSDDANDAALRAILSEWTSGNSFEQRVGNVTDGAAPNINPLLDDPAGDTLLGDVGRDLLFGDIGDDTVRGGQDDDLVNAGAGNDTINGDEGDDQLNADGGDDLLIWNNGDGSDLIEGGADNDTQQVNGDPTGGDEFSISSNGGRVMFQRNNLGQFTLDIGTTETLDVNGDDGDDTFDVGGSLSTTELDSIDLDGGNGTNDTLNFNFTPAPMINGTPPGPFTVNSPVPTDGINIENVNGATTDNTPPQVSITVPINGSAVVEGSSVPVTVEAVDDIQVREVELLVNGQVVATDISFPYEFNATAPAVGDPFVITAVARDTADNQATSSPVQLLVLPVDPFEPDDTIGDAVDQDQIDGVPRAITPGDVDFKRLRFGELDSVDVTPDPPDANIQVDLFVLPFGNDVHSAQSGSGQTATWNFTGLPAGMYQVSATWTADTNRSSAAQYTILDGGTPQGSTQVNQQIAPADTFDGGVPWQVLDSVTITGSELVVELNDVALDGRIIADAIRIEPIGGLPEDAVIIDNDVNGNNAFTATPGFTEVVGEPGVFEPTTQTLPGGVIRIPNTDQSIDGDIFAGVSGSTFEDAFIYQVDLVPAVRVSVTGIAYEDLNGNGVRDAGEPAVAGAEVSLTPVGGGTVLTTLTDGTGAYGFDEVGQGDKEFRVKADSFFDVLFNLTVGGVNITQDAGLTRPGFFDIHKCHDILGHTDGVCDPGIDEGINGVEFRVYEQGNVAAGQEVAVGVTQSVDLNSDGHIDPFTERGLLTIDNLRVDREYVVAEVVEPGSTPIGLEDLGQVDGDTLAGFSNVRIGQSGGRVDFFFPNRYDLLTLDFGDAPDPTYPTLEASDGARHFLASPVFLGAGVDDEPDGQPTVPADGDDTDTDGDDEDGVDFSGTALLPGFMTAYVVTAASSGFLDAWVDWNQDGTWSPGEQIADSFPISAPGPGPSTIPVIISVPASALPGETYARFRFSRSGGLDPTGLAPNGEVEDYLLTVKKGKAVLSGAFGPGDFSGFTIAGDAPNVTIASEVIDSVENFFSTLFEGSEGAIQQDVELPATVTDLNFDFRFPPGLGGDGDELQVNIDGQTIATFNGADFESDVFFPSGPIDLRPFAGQTVTLEIRAGDDGRRERERRCGQHRHRSGGRVRYAAAGLTRAGRVHRFQRQRRDRVATRRW